MSAAYLAMDLGGTKTELGLVREDGHVLSRRRLLTPELRAGGDPLAALIRLGRQVLDEAGVAIPAGVGVALPGPADVETFRMLSAPTIPELQDVPLRQRLESAFGCPAAGENDANACALAELRFGAGRGCRSLLYFTVSTGIGGGAVLDGQVYRGSHGTSAEMGHQVLQAVGGPRCDCGSEGCLEALASGRGILARARAAGLECRDAGEVADLARAGHPAAGEVWRETALFLGLGVGNAINLFDPEVVVLGGGVSLGAADLLLEPVREVVRGRCMPNLARPVPLRLAALGADLGLVSAAVLVMPPYSSEPTSAAVK